MKIVAIDYDGTLTEGSLSSWAIIVQQFQRMGFHPMVASYNSGPEPRQAADILGIPLVRCAMRAPKTEAFRLAGMPRPAIWIDDMPELCGRSEVIE